MRREIRVGPHIMMTIPFFVFAAGLVAIWSNRRDMAMALWGVGAVTMLVLFRIHATSQLGLGL